MNCAFIAQQVLKAFAAAQLVILTIPFAVAPVSVHAASRPNIIIILADDLGYGDVGVYGCRDILTPNIDAIAAKGVRFTQGYASQPVCAPSRAGLLSGMYSQRFGFENNSGPEKFAASSFGLPREISTLAEKLKAAGYKTGLVGKWHLGFKKGLRPNDRGFDYFYGFIGGSRSYNPRKSQSNAPLLRNEEIVTVEKDHLTDAFAREAGAFIRSSSAATSPALEMNPGSDLDHATSQPFFLYLAFNAVHLPMEPIPKYEDNLKHISDPKRRTYAGMLSAMDDGIGRVMEALREVGQEDNTLVFFYSDNGGPTSHTSASNEPLRGSKGELYEGGIRVPFLMQWTGKFSGNRTFEKPVIAFDCHATALSAASIPNHSLDGKDLLPYITDEITTTPHPYLFWRFGDQKAVRHGDWKLVQTTAAAPAELFNLREDVSEQRNLAGQHPDVLSDLARKIGEWEKEMKPPAWKSSEGKGAE